MNAIIVTGGKQYKVSEGDVIYIEKLDNEAGDTESSSRSWLSSMMRRLRSALPLWRVLPWRPRS